VAFAHRSFLCVLLPAVAVASAPQHPRRFSIVHRVVEIHVYIVSYRGSFPQHRHLSRDVSARRKSNPPYPILGPSLQVRRKIRCPASIDVCLRHVKHV
jgi:hypothetical protein